MKRIAALVILALILCGVADAEKPTEAWVMCQLNSTVNARTQANKHARAVCTMFAGDRVQLTGRKVGRWYHCIIPCENGEGWIRGDYLSFTEPEIFEDGKLFVTNSGNLFARFSIRGNIRVKLKKGAKLKVYLMAEEWSVTSQGFVMTKYLEEVETVAGS